MSGNKGGSQTQTTSKPNPAPTGNTGTKGGAPTGNTGTRGGTTGTTREK